MAARCQFASSLKIMTGAATTGTVVLATPTDGGQKYLTLSQQPFAITLPANGQWTGVVTTQIIDQTSYEHTLGSGPYAWYGAQVTLTSAAGTVVPLGSSSHAQMSVRDANPQ